MNGLIRKKEINLRIVFLLVLLSSLKKRYIFVTFFKYMIKVKIHESRLYFILEPF